MNLNIEQMLIDKNFAIGRNGRTIDKIAIHHAAGMGKLTQMAEIFRTLGRNGSAHYGVRGQDIAQFVLEENTAWANSNRDVNQNSISIEVVNSGGAPDWPISTVTYETLIKLVFDIAFRHKMLPLIVGKNLVWHSMFAATLCPGPWLLDHMADLADRVNNIADTSNFLAELIEPNQPVDYKLNVIYRVRNLSNDPQSQQGAFHDFGKAQILCNVLNDGPEKRWAVFNQDGEKLYPKGNLK